MTDLQIRTLAPSERVGDALEVDMFYYLREFETPEQSAAAFARKYGRPAGEVLVVGNRNYIKLARRIVERA